MQHFLYMLNDYKILHCISEKNFTAEIWKPPNIIHYFQYLDQQYTWTYKLSTVWGERLINYLFSGSKKKLLFIYFPFSNLIINYKGNLLEFASYLAHLAISKKRTYLVEQVLCFMLHTGLLPLKLHSSVLSFWDTRCINDTPHGVKMANGTF